MCESTERLVKKYIDFLYTRGLQGVLNLYPKTDPEFRDQIVSFCNKNLFDFMLERKDSELEEIRLLGNRFCWFTIAQINNKGESS